MSGACGSQQAASVLGSSVRSAALGGVARNPNSPPRLRGPPGQAGDQLIALFVSGRLSGALHPMRRGSFDVPHVGFVRCRTSGSENRATLIEGSKIRNRCRKPRARLLATRVAKSARRRPRRAQQAIEHQSLASVGETTQRGRDRRHDANDQSHKTDHWSLLADRDGRAWPSSTDASGVTRSQGRSSRTRRALKGSGAQHRNDAAWRRIRRRARLRELVSDPVGCLMAPVAGRVGCHSHWGVRCPPLGLVRFSQNRSSFDLQDLATWCRGNDQIPALGIKGACGRYPATKYVLFKIRRPDRSLEGRGRQR
jgi:hypothetical protein